MNIEFKSQLVKFSDVKRGDFFLYDHTLFLKIKDEPSDKNNVFNCYTDYVNTIYKDTRVKPMKIKLVEEGD